MVSKQTDFYLNPDNVLNRLRDEYLRYGKLIIACDFDDTIYDFHRKSNTYTNVIELLRMWKAKAEIIITSCINEGDDVRLQFVTDYLRDNDIPYNKINEQSENSPTPRASKIYSNVLLDDRAGLRECYGILLSLHNEIESWSYKNGGRANI